MEMVIEQEQKVVASAFGKRNTNKDRIEQEEVEIAALEKGNVLEQKEQEQEPQDVEEKTFKKRYGDLRRHAQEQENKLKRQIDELSKQLQQSTEQQIQLPKSEEELAAWAETYPDVAKIVETIAIKKAKEQSVNIEQKLKVLDEREKQTKREKAEAELLRLHPDFDDIRSSDDFHSWVEDQPQWVQDALYANENDAIYVSTATSITLKNVSNENENDLFVSRWVSQKINDCEGPRSKIEVLVPAKVTPVVTPTLATGAASWATTKYCTMLSTTTPVPPFNKL
jgi:metal-dependent amidase/aminoacylase/carboxypeptidase family protein